MVREISSLMRTSIGLSNSAIFLLICDSSAAVCSLTFSLYLRSSLAAAGVPFLGLLSLVAFLAKEMSSVIGSTVLLVVPCCMTALPFPNRPAGFVVVLCMMSPLPMAIPSYVSVMRSSPRLSPLYVLDTLPLGFILLIVRSLVSWRKNVLS